MSESSTGDRYQCDECGGTVVETAAGRECEDCHKRFPPLRTDGGRKDLRGTAGRHSHGLLLGKKWNEKAEENIHKWGHQRHDTTFLALIEEIGEIAMAFEAGNAPGGGPHPYVDRDDPHSYGRDLIHRMAELGRDTREFLESEYPDPAGDGDGGHEYTLHGDPNSADDAERIFEEVDDAAPLLFQLYWALESRDVDTGSNGGRS